MNLENLFQFAFKATIKAGIEILNIYNSDNLDFSIEKKQDNSPVTIADKKANTIITKILNKSDINILSEEGKYEDYSTRSHWNYFWLVDPLDGTKEFLKKNDEFTVNIALIKENAPIFGLIYIPVLKTLYFSYDNKPFKIILSNPKKALDLNMDDLIKQASIISPKKKKEVYTIIASRSHQTDELKDYIIQKEKEIGDTKLISFGSSIKFCKMAEGEADIYPRIGYTMEWDTGAGHSICKAAGLKVCNYYNGRELIYNKENLRNPYFIVQ